MAIRKIKDLAVKTGSYQSSDGETKNRYENVGGVFEGENGKFIMLKRSFNPAGVPFKEGSDSIMVSMFDVKERDGSGSGGQRQPQRSAPQQSSGGGRAMDDDIPFGPRNDPF